MNRLTTTLTAAALAVTSCATAAFADNISTVQKFYDLLSNPGSDKHVAEFVSATSENWESIGDYTGKNKTRDAFLGQMGFFAQLIPDLDWAVQAMHEADGFVTVRSRATGTPVGPLFGVDGQGKGFEILTIDIHKLEDGKITQTFHVEDWAGALQQLSGK